MRADQGAACRKGVPMRIVEVTTKQQQKRFLAFRRECYRTVGRYVDNQAFMLREVFAGKTCFPEHKDIRVLYVEDEERVLCQGILIWAEELPEYAQLCFFESREGQEAAVELLLKEAKNFGKGHGCKRLVIGLYGHVNYGLGFQTDRYEEKNSFSAAGNPAYYNEYFAGPEFEKIYLNSYKTARFGENIKRFERLLRHVEKSYTFRYFDKKNFDRDAKIYTDLNNVCFAKHRYYYKRNYKEDAEMLKELFLFMKEDSVIFAYDGDTPVGFVMWYPEYNELLRGGEEFGVTAFFKNRLFGHKIETVKVMEFGILEEHRRKGLPLALVNHVYLCAQKRGIHKAESSWVLAENGDSNSVCSAVCEENYKRYVVYETQLS